MFRAWRSKPYKPFFLLGIVCAIITVLYQVLSPETYFDLSFYEYMTLNHFYVWLIFTCYVFLLSGVYYVTHRKGLHVRTWMLRSHFVFISIFLILLFTFSLFNTVSFQHITSGMPFLVLFGIYGIIFFIDLVLFGVSLVLLLVNIFSMKKD